jgi:hypothetical protein
LHHGKIFIVSVERTFICRSDVESEIDAKKVANDIRKFPSFLSHVCLKYKKVVHPCKGTEALYRPYGS